MARFLAGQTQLLVATTVIEVGVNVPAATIMVIERAETFGLAQLHQLRGRVGRGEAESTCLMLYQPPLTDGGERRLKVIRDTEDGFRIAEEDLALRGAGDLIGTAQSGLPRFRMADLERQSALMAVAQSDARALLTTDPALESPRGKAARLFFHTEYRLNHLLFTYPKPVVAIMDGVTMGGGVGLAMPSSVRIATERTIFAMPETGIGLFPDVGGGWFLPRLPGRTGLWLALTGARIKGADCVSLGIATHYMPSGGVEAFKAALLAHPDTVAGALAGFVEDPGHARIAAHRADIDRLFDGDSVETILDRLAVDGGEWAAEQLATLATKSPQTLKVAFRQLAHGAAFTDFADNMVMEYRIGARVVRMHDFLEGVRAVIIDKDNAPRWSPATVQEVEDAVLDDIFAPLPADEEWTPLT